jgi:hypothetical protein
MHGGLFTGKKLSDYITASKTDYVNARKIINGTDKAALIAGYAKQFEQILRDSATDTANDDPTANIGTDTNKKSDDTATTPPPENSPAPIVPTTGVSPESLVAVQTPVVEVESVTAQESPIDKTISKWSSRFVAIPAAVLSFLGGAWTWITNSPTDLTITLIIAGSAVAIFYVIGRQIVQMRREARADNLQAAREERAHAVQMAMINSAADPNMQAVRVVSPPTTELPSAAIHTEGQ